MRTPEANKKQSESLKERYKTGLEPWNKGKSWSELYTDEERRIRFGKTKGTHQSEETKKKRADKLRGQKRTEEQKLKYKEAARKRAIRYKETGISKAIGEKTRELKSIKIYCPQLDKVFNSIKEANLYFHTSRIYDQLERTQQGKLYKGKYQFYRVSKEG